LDVLSNSKPYIKVQTRAVRCTGFPLLEVEAMFVSLHFTSTFLFILNTSRYRKYQEEQYEKEGIVEQEAMEAAKARAIITTEEDVKSSLAEVKDEYDD
jgi:hypothetical protein